MTLTAEQLRGTPCDVAARKMYEAGDLQGLLTMAFGGEACACMGPQDGEPECPCRMTMEAAGRYLSIVMVDPDATNP